MRALVRPLAFLVAVAAGCGANTPETESGDEGARAIVMHDAGAADASPPVTSPRQPAEDAAPPSSSSRDDDGDGLADADEDAWLNEFAPVLYLKNDEWTLPANVDWYLARTKLEFHHHDCSDCDVLAVGIATQATLLAQTHAKKNALVSLDPCAHGSTVVSAENGPWDNHQHFYLHPPDDHVHGGAPDPADWIVYGHVYPGESGGVQVQYWFFYAYNDNFSAINHEADWESIIVSLSPARQPLGVHFCQHGDCAALTPLDHVSWFHATHPLVWTADGSHASYPDKASCDANFVLEGLSNHNCDTSDEHRWFTWSGGRGTDPGFQGGGVLNVGELDAPLHGQSFVRFIGRWGSIGVIDDLSGPPTPAMQSSWNLGRAP